MRKRVLNESGKFSDFKGERVLHEVKPSGQAVAERKELEKRAEAVGVSPNNPVDGGLSEDDREKVKAGMSIPEMKALAKMRGISIPSNVKKSADIQEFLLNGEEEDL